MNILLLNAHSPQNAGDRALLQESLATLLNAFPAATISVAINDTSDADLPNAAAYVPSLTRWLVSLDALGTWRWHKWRALPTLVWLLITALLYRAAGLRCWPADPARRDLMRAYYAADLVAVIGGGHLYAPHAFNIAFLWLWVGLALALALGKPLVLLPQSFGPLPGRLQRVLLRWIINHSALTVAREYRSAQMLAELHPHRRVLVMPDLAFSTGERNLAELCAALPVYAALVQERARPLVGLTLMDWGGQNPRFPHQHGYETAIRALVLHVQHQYGARVVFFSQCYGPTPAHDDRRIARRVATALAGAAEVTVIDAALAPDLLKAAYRQLDMLVATRMHSAIFALAAGVPTVAIGYLHKSLGIMEMLHLARCTLDIETITPEQLCETFDQVWQQRRDLRLQLARDIPVMQHTLARLPAHIQGAVHNNERATHYGSPTR